MCIDHNQNRKKYNSKWNGKAYEVKTTDILEGKI